MLTNEVRNRSEAELGEAKSREAGGQRAWSREQGVSKAVGNSEKKGIKN
jgi:hypothetical protein